jgi:hypothetical protein
VQLLVDVLRYDAPLIRDRGPYIVEPVEQTVLAQVLGGQRTVSEVPQTVIGVCVQDCLYVVIIS